jgi:hypothetical protein
MYIFYSAYLVAIAKSEYQIKFLQFLGNTSLLNVEYIIEYCGDYIQGTLGHVGI